MKRKEFALILIALLIIGSAGLILFNRHRDSWNVRDTKAGDKVLPNFRYNDVATIHVKSGSAEFNVARKEGIWRVPDRADYPANYQLIKDMLIRIRDIKVLQADTVGPSQLPRVELADPGKGQGSGTLVEFKDEKGQLIDSLIVGKRHMRPETKSDPYRMHGLFDGCYVRIPSDPQNVLLISDDLAAVSPDAQAWLSQSFVKIDNIRSLSLIGTNGLNSWTLVREADGRPWMLADASADAGETLDSTAASQVTEVIPFLTFSDVLANPAATASANSSQKPRTLFIETFDHFFYTLKFSPASDAAHYVLNISIKASIPAGKDNAKELQDKLAREQSLAAWTYVVESASIDPILRDRSRLVQKKTVAAGS